MPRTVTVGLDGSPESLAAAEWAAALGLPLDLVQVWEPVPAPMAQAPLLGPETHQHWTDRIPRETAAGLRQRHPGVEVNGEHLSGSPADVLARASKDAELLVLGSRGLGGIGGFLVGSVGLSVLAHAHHPVVFVRSHRQEPDRPVVLGLDTDHPDSTLMDFAFDAAVRRAVPLRVVHAWNPSPYIAYGTPDSPPLHAALALDDAEALADAVRPWRQKFPDVEVVEESRYGSAAEHLVAAAREAPPEGAPPLLVVGRRGRRSPFGTHIGHVTHAVLHHSPAPVAVVSHG
ncbi:universal stress protein [Streptomyces acidiscabies]|uniref:Stress-inducible protein n=1 Tax=Streptomyces acidiscabies TaxID=42234 RepID=A0A0L0JSQ5_9ACTN|nr:universal stress protein [Streptomyces acidiscabies]KND28485.1 stress-inducible protein [Streptomyces acidiscabies]